MIPLNDFKKEASKYKTELLTACENVIDSGWYILGEHVRIFEEKFAQHMDSEYAIGVANGMEAIQIALLTCGVSSGDEVITTPLSAFATTLAIMNVGAKPVFVDIEESTLNINPDLIEEKINDRTKAIVPVHLYGNPCRIEDIRDICEKHGLELIEDACQAHAAVHKGKKVGNFGRCGCFSFYPTKNLGAIGDGGALTMNDEVFYTKAKALRDYGQTGKYEHTFSGLNSRLDELQAAILSVKLTYLADNNRRRQQIADMYISGIRHPEIIPVEITADSVSVRHLFVVKTPYRNRLMEYLKERGIMSAIHYPKGIHNQPAYVDSVTDTPSLPVCDKMVNEILSLPINPELTDENVGGVIDALNCFEV